MGVCFTSNAGAYEYDRLSRHRAQLKFSEEQTIKENDELKAEIRRMSLVLEASNIPLPEALQVPTAQFIEEDDR